MQAITYTAMKYIAVCSLTETSASLRGFRLFFHILQLSRLQPLEKLRWQLPPRASVQLYGPEL